MRHVLYLSKRGIPLAWNESGVEYLPVLTVEVYSKWYVLHVIERPGGKTTIREVCFSELEGYEPAREVAYCDHCPNPNAVARYTEKHGLHLDEQAHEMMIGRWELEYRNESPYRSPL